MEPPNFRAGSAAVSGLLGGLSVVAIIFGVGFLIDNNEKTSSMNWSWAMIIAGLIGALVSIILLVRSQRAMRRDIDRWYKQLRS